MTLHWLPPDLPSAPSLHVLRCDVCRRVVARVYPRTQSTWTAETYLHGKCVGEFERETCDSAKAAAMADVQARKAEHMLEPFVVRNGRK